MYKIYINEVSVFLSSSKPNRIIDDEDRKHVVAKYNGDRKQLLQYIDTCEKTKKLKSVHLYSKEKDQLIKDFESLFKIIDAGGGLVVNEKNEVLFIFRRGYWDLPKGKIDEGETKREAALREVKEETGIKNIHMDKKITTTYHTYRIKNKRYIKRAHWYLMFTDRQPLIPQEEEDIQDAKWMRISKFYALDQPVYNSILEVLQTATKKSPNLI